MAADDATQAAITPTEQAVDALVRDLLRQSPSPVVRALHARLIDEGRIDWPTLIATLRRDPAYAPDARDPDDRTRVTDRIKAASGSTVLGGPFAGMRIADRSARGDGDLAPKLLGTYEQELHPAIAACAARRYDAIIDIGSAEGYYAVGLARLFPATPVFAFDMDPDAHAALAENARQNGCSQRIFARGVCDGAALTKLCHDHPNALVVCDCEGDEAELFADAPTIAAVRRADLIVECHDRWDGTITPRLLAALSPTHDVARVDQGGRDPNAFACLADLDEWDRWRAVWERRGATQHWLVCTSRAACEPHS